MHLSTDMPLRIQVFSIFLYHHFVVCVFYPHVHRIATVSQTLCSHSRKIGGKRAKEEVKRLGEECLLNLSMLKSFLIFLSQDFCLHLLGKK